MSKPTKEELRLEGITQGCANCETLARELDEARQLILDLREEALRGDMNLNELIYYVGDRTAPFVEK